MFEDIIKRIESYIKPVLDDIGLEIVEFSMNYRNKTVALVLLVDYTDGGVTIDECTRINKKIGKFIEAEGLLEGDYTIEVSSPGLDRPLKTEKDFLRTKGKKVKFHLREPLENKLEHDGVVQEVSSGSVTIDVKLKSINIPLTQIQKAVQIIQYMGEKNGKQ